MRTVLVLAVVAYLLYDAVHGALLRGDSVGETSEAVLDHVPGRSVRHGGLFFRNDPRAYRLELRAAGYQEP